VTSSGNSARFTADVARSWSLIDARDRKRLGLVALYGVLIAGLDTVALILVYGLLDLLNNQPVTGLAGRAVDVLGLSGAERYHAALVLLAVTAALFVARSSLSVIGLWWTYGAAYSAEAELMARLLAGHAGASQLVRLERNSAETLRTILSSVDQVTMGVIFSSVFLVSNVAVTLAVALGLFLSSPFVALTVTIYFVLIALAWTRVVRRGLATRGQRVQELQGERYRLILQGIAAAKELQLRGRARFYAEEAAGHTRTINRAMRVVGVANASLRFMLESALVLGAVIVVGAAGFTGGRESVLPAVGLVLAASFRFLPALNQVLFLTNTVRFSAPAIDLVEQEVRTFGATPAAAVQSDDEVAPHPLREGLRLDEVTFRYPTRAEDALRGVTLHLDAGETLGIVGPTGSGKSTLLDVILGMLDPVTGNVILDGESLANHRAEWQRSIGYVPQDVYLVDDTLSANVALGWYGSEIDEARVREVVSLAGLDDVVAVLPDGYDTVLGERGVRLSGGQRQRVGLARALYTRPSVLVLDEATSNLDQETERRIVDTLAELQGGVTMVIVTHRIASVRHCDRLVYLDRGVVRAAGTFEHVRAVIPGFDDPPPPLRLARG
jgi:ABC-type multidrug transport system fused ATPase/permease subunit